VTVNAITASNLRRLIPASAVAVVLAISYLGPLPSFASSGGVGYNCGVKGIGYKVNGKACPNRPFPGHGKGITKFTGTSPVESVGAETVGTDTSTTSESSTASETGGGASAQGKGHGHGKSHGHGLGSGK
jgi:hypothetical protein